VFLDAAVPSGVAPASLVYSGNPSFASASPLLRQLFWIGDGLTGTGTGAAQTFVPPAGATRVCFGIEDSGNPAANLPLDGYSDNGGSFSVTWTMVGAPAPGPAAAVPALSPLGLALAALLIAIAAIAYTRRRR
jgi:hypothetical protein